MKSIFVSAGHSEVDPGACANDRREADIAVEFRNMVSFYLHREGVAHGMDGNGTVNLPLRLAADAAKRHDVAVEFHCNAGLPTATGVETLSAQNRTVLGERICEAIVSALGIRNRGAKPEAAGRHSKLAFCQAGGVIVELFFITNTSDLRAYDARKWVAAKKVADVLITYAKG